MLWNIIKYPVIDLSVFGLLSSGYRFKTRIGIQIHTPNHTYFYLYILGILLRDSNRKTNTVMLTNNIFYYMYKRKTNKTVTYIHTQNS